MLVVHSGEERGIAFQDRILEDSLMSYFRYMYVYNSGGVTSGDLDNDGLPELFFTSMNNGSALYHNLGELRFQDITHDAGIDLKNAWATGVTMVDVNADGLLDIYVCLSGPSQDPRQLANKLFINHGDLRFTEEAEAYGLNDAGHSQMAYFHDLDQDGDLDLYLVSTRIDFEHNKAVNSAVLVNPRSPFTDRLYINDGNGRFTDRTSSSGVLNHAWGLAAAVGDMNGDGSPDIYVSDDFTEPDQLFVNQGGGRFQNDILNVMRHICLFAMGVDRADFNNDGLQDLVVVDMTPPDHYGSKTNMASMRPKNFQLMVDAGWHHQYMTNMLQLNNGNGTFSDIAHLAGVDRTGWSWAPLFADLDNDGWKDLFITNGVWRETGNNDAKVRLEQMKRSMGRRIRFEDAIALFPLGHTDNFVFRNNGDLTFSKMMDDWGYHQNSVSTGATYADLDNDGDIDLVTCDMNAPVRVIENRNRDAQGTHYLAADLRAPAPNTFAVGATAVLHTDKGDQYAEVALARGFQSGVDPVLHFGLGDATPVTMDIHWPDGTWSTLSDLKKDTRLTIHQDQIAHAVRAVEKERPWMKDEAVERGLVLVHQESDFDDFKDEILLPHAQSQHGPRLAVADANGDGLEDLFVGAASGHVPVLFLQTAAGGFRPSGNTPWAAHKQQEFIGEHFFDADGDGDQDLYLAAGSTEFGREGPAYQDRLYINDGHGHFTEANGALPDMPTSTQVVMSWDVDGDGDLDLFVGGRNVPGAYPTPPKSYLLINEGHAFVDRIAQWAPDLEHAGMITDAVHTDLDGDGEQDLIVCGEWMPLCCFLKRENKLVDATDTWTDPGISGWWYDLKLADLDGDGDQDLVAGNLGLNNKFHPSTQKPLEIYMADLDDSGTNDIVLAKHQSDSTCVPVRGRECSSEQMPFIKQRFGTYNAFAKADLDQLYGHDKLQKALHLHATDLRSMVWWNDGGHFTPSALPNLAQIAPVRGCIVDDVNNDGRPDLVVAGNLYGSEVETTRYDAGNGLVLLGDGKRGFTPVPVLTSGLFAPDDVRDLQVVHLGKAGLPLYVIASNSGPLRAFAMVAPPKPNMIAQR